LILDFQADEETLRGRIARRNAAEADASEADLAVLDEQRQSREPLSDAERRASIRVETAETGWPRQLEHAVRKWFTAQ
jgi:predicted kinase